MLPKVSPTPSNTPSNTATITPSATSCPSFITPSATGTNIPTSTPTPSITNTPTNTITPTVTPTPSTIGFDPDAADYLEQVLFAGGTGITATISGATNTMFVDLKDEGIYNKIFCLYPLLGGAANPHAINAVDTGSFFMQWNGGITHDALGSKGNGTNGFGNTQWIQNNETTAANTTLGFYMSLSGNAGYDMGRQVAGGFVTINNYQNLTNLRAGLNSGLSNFQTNMTGQTGFYGITRNNATQVSHISPNASATSSSNETTVLATASMGVMTISGFGTFSTKTYGTFIIAEGLTLTELQTLSTIITTFNNTIGR